MAFTRTTLSAAIKASDILIPVASTATGFPAVGAITLPQQPMVVDDEWMFIVQVPSPNLVLVRTRGADGTQAVPHDINAAVVTSNVLSDFSFLVPGSNQLAPGMSTVRPVDAPDVVTYGQSGPIAIPIEPISTAQLTAPAGGVYTIGAPSLLLNGVILKLTSTVAQAHTLTAQVAGTNTALFQTGGAGTPFTVITWPAQIGAGLELMAANGFWNINSSNGAFTFA